MLRMTIINLGESLSETELAHERIFKIVNRSHFKLQFGQYCIRSTRCLPGPFLSVPNLGKTIAVDKICPV
jgi:hypothetical protein